MRARARLSPLVHATGVLLLATGLAACGTSEPPPTAADAATTPRRTAVVGADPAPGLTAAEPDSTDGVPGRPPPVTVRAGSKSFGLNPFTYCYQVACVDGIPPHDPPFVRDASQVVIDFPLDAWSFTATFQPTGDSCGRMQTVRLQAVKPGSFLLHPLGRAGTYDVTLFGRGEGDLAAIFRWTTPVDGPLPKPESRLAVLADHDGTVDSYGVELEVSNLAATPASATAAITVTAKNGASLTFPAARSQGGCWPEGTAYWDGPDAKGLAAAALGQAPFTYTVTLELEGRRYVATAHWPDDEIAENEPSVALEFDPALPALD